MIGLYNAPNAKGLYCRIGSRSFKFVWLRHYTGFEFYNGGAELLYIDMGYFSFQTKLKLN